MLTQIEFIIIIAAIVYSATNCLGFLCVFYKLFQNRRRYHRNQIILRFIHLFICLFMSISITVCGSILLNHNIPILLNLESWSYYMYRVFAIIFTACAIGIRFVTLGVTMERLIATCFVATYEKKFKRPFIGSLIAFASLTMGIGFSICYHVKVYSFYVHMSILTSADCLNILAIVLLIRKNKALKKLNSQSEIILSERYQITENLRILFELQPMLISQSVIMLIAMLVVFPCILLGKFYVDWVYYGLMNLSVTVLFAITLLREPIMERLAAKKVKNSEAVIVNALGQVLAPNQTDSDYFEKLKQQWG